MARLAIAVVFVLLALPAAASAQPIDPPPPLPPAQRLELAVGQTLDRPVGLAIGHRCDDPSLVTITMSSPTPTANIAVVTGVKPGSTTCRIGTDPLRPSVLFEIRVLPKRATSA